MPRPEPQESMELMLLRQVMYTDPGDDDRTDVALGRYRTKIMDDFDWAQRQLRVAEKEYRAELAAWHKECREEEAAKQAAKQVKQTKTNDMPAKGAKADVGTARALEMLDKLIVELTKS